MNERAKQIIANAEKTDSIAQSKWRIENREQLRKQRKKELKELMKKHNEFKLVQETGNGWKQLSFTFTAASSPRWWQFWMREIKPQEFTASMWIKPDDEIRLTMPTIEATNK